MVKWFREKFIPFLGKLLRGLLFGLIVGWGYLFLVSVTFKFYIYLIGILIGTLGYFVVTWLARKMIDWEFLPVQEEIEASEGEE